MIKIVIIVKDNKIGTDFTEKDVTLSENSMAVRELEFLKLHFLKKKFKPEWRVDAE